MSDFEDRIRRTLDENLNAVAAEPGRAAETMRRARRGRALRGVAAGLATVLVVAAAAIAFEQRDGDDRPRPAAQPQANTFRLDFGDTGDGTLTIDVPKAQACIHLSRNLALVTRELGYARDDGELVAELPVAGGPACRPIDPGDAARVLADPALHYVRLGVEGTQNLSALEPFDAVPPLLPDVAEIVCSNGGAVVMTPRVQPQEDGVHVRFHDDGDRWTSFNLVTDDGDNEGGDLNGGEFTTAFGPGTLYAGCFEHLDDASMSPRDPAYAKLLIVDHAGLWTEVDLHCAAPEKRAPIDTGQPRVSPEQFDELIREHVPGVEPTDELERPRYPGTEFHFEPRTVVRDGRRIAGLSLVDGRGNWAIDARVCPGSGIAERS